MDLIDRSRPHAFQPMSQDPPNPRVVRQEAASSRESSDVLEDKFAQYLRNDDCASIVGSVSGRDYEGVKPEILAVIASCEPPGKDPEKMFIFAEKRRPESDLILLLHARYLWRKQRPGAEELFERLAEQTKDPRLKSLAEQYVEVPERAGDRLATDFHFAVTGFLGGLQESNPLQVPISSASFGQDLSTAGVGNLSLSVSKSSGELTTSFDYIVNDTTYWKTHSADLLSQDADLPIERSIGEGRRAGLRPFGSLYLLNGTRYYTVTGFGFTGSADLESGAHWAQISYYRDDYAPSESAAQSADHLRFDWHTSLKKVPVLQPVAFFAVDYAKAGADIQGMQYIPYSHTDFSAGVSVNRVVHRYSVGLAFRALYREDQQNSRIIDPTGQFVSKIRKDFQFVAQPNMTVPIGRGLDLFMYFESNSTGSTLRVSDGLDRNISDSTVGAILRASVANF